MFISSIFVLILLSEVMAHEGNGCSVTKVISGTCGSSTSIEYEMEDLVDDQGHGHRTNRICFRVANGECLNPVVEVLHLGDFNGDGEFFRLGYWNPNDGVTGPVTCHGGDRCRAWATCRRASGLVTETVWNAGDLHGFFVPWISPNSNGCPLRDHGADIARESRLKLKVTVTCDEAACLFDKMETEHNETTEALSTCFCGDEITESTESTNTAIQTSQNETVSALDTCFCSNEIAESTESINTAIQTSQSEVIGTLNTCLCENEIAASTETLEGRLDDVETKLDELIKMLSSDDYSPSSEEEGIAPINGYLYSPHSGSAEEFGAKTMSNERMEGSDGSKVIRFKLGNDFILIPFVFIMAISMVVGSCWFCAKYKN